MVAVTTVLEPVETDALGMTLMHEQVFVQNPEIMNNYGEDWWDEDIRVANAVNGPVACLRLEGTEQILGYYWSLQQRQATASNRQAE